MAISEETVMRALTKTRLMLFLKRHIIDAIAAAARSYVEPVILLFRLWSPPPDPPRPPHKQHAYDHLEDDAEERKAA